MRMVRVTWDDTYCITEGWTERSKVKAERRPISSVGYPIRDDGEGVILAQSVDPTVDHVDNALWIPRGSIRRVERLRAR